MLYLVDVEAIFYLPSGKHTKNDGKSQFLMGKVTISMAIFISKVLVYQMVVPNTCCPRYFSFLPDIWHGGGLGWMNSRGFKWISEPVQLESQ